MCSSLQEKQPEEEMFHEIEGEQLSLLPQHNSIGKYFGWNLFLKLPAGGVILDGSL